MTISGGPFAPCTLDCCRVRYEPEANFHGAPDLVRAERDGPYRAKCKRLRPDGPTPCLCCEGECVGDVPTAEDLFEEAEDRMYAASAASKRHRQRSLAFGCLVPIGLGIVLLILALAVGGGQ